MDDFYYPISEPPYTDAAVFEFDGLTDMYSATAYEHIFNEQYAKQACGARSVIYTFTNSVSGDPSYKADIPATATLETTGTNDGLIQTTGIPTYVNMGNENELTNVY